MATKKTNELMTGLFVLTTLVTLLVVVIWVGAMDFLAEAGQDVSFFVKQNEGSVGLRAGSEVFYGDVRVGKIIDIKPQPGKGCLYHVQLERNDITIHSNARAEVTSSIVGKTLLVVKDLGGGKNAKKPDKNNPIHLKVSGVNAFMAAAGAELDAGSKTSLLAKFHSTADDLKKISTALRLETDRKKAQALLSKTHAIVTRLGTMAKSLGKVTDETNPKSILSNVQTSSDNLKKITSDIRRQTDPNNDKSMVASLRRSVDNAEQITKDAKAKLSKSFTSLVDNLAELRKANTEILKVVKNFSTFSQNAKEIILVNHENIDEIVENMTEVSANLKATSQEIRWKPWKLLHKPDEKEIRTHNLYNAARAFSQGAGKLNQAIAKLKQLKRLHPKGLPADDPKLKEIQKALKETFTNFKKAEDGLWKELVQ